MLKSSILLTCWGLIISVAFGQQGLYNKKTSHFSINGAGRGRDLPFHLMSKDFIRLTSGERSNQKDSSKELPFFMMSKDSKGLPHFWDGKDERKDSELPFHWMSKDSKGLPYFWDSKTSNRLNHKEIGRA